MKSCGYTEDKSRRIAILGDIMGEKKKAERMAKLRKDYKKIRNVLEQIMKDCDLSGKIDMSQFYAKEIDAMQDSELYELGLEMKKLSSALLENHFLEPWVEAIKRGYEPDKQAEMINVVGILIQRDPLNVYEHYSDFFRILDGLNSEDKKIRKKTLLQIQDYASEMTSEDVINKLFELTKTKHGEDVMLALIDGSSKCEKNFPHYVEACLGRNAPQRGE